MSRLKPLRSRLAALKRRRSGMRTLLAAVAVLVALCWLVLAAFVLDWSFEFPVWGRVLLLICTAGGLLWSVLRFAKPELAVHETIEDMALLVERQQAIDSDLIAALQFDAVHKTKVAAVGVYGSEQLSSAVVGYVAEFSPGLNVFEGFSWAKLRNRFLWLGGLCVLLIGGSLIFPGHARAFGARMLLAADHYPTAVTINSISVSGERPKGAKTSPRPPLVFSVEHGIPGEPSGSRRFPYGGKLRFAVRCDANSTDDLPAVGTVFSKTAKTGQLVKTQLTRGEIKDNAATYTATASELRENLEFQIRIGAAWTEFEKIELIPLPVVDVEPIAKEPTYARSEGQEKSEQRASELRVLQGSDVGFRVRCANKKLKSARLTLHSDGEKLAAYNMAPEEGGMWSVPVSGTKLENVTKQFTYSVQVVDEDGLSLPKPKRGTITIRRDHPPQATVSVRDPAYLASGTPYIRYDASDDYGLKSLNLQVEVVRAAEPKPDGKPGKAKVEVLSTVNVKLPNKAKRALDRQQLPLATYKLNLGDTVRIRLIAADFRGNLSSQVTTSKPIDFKIVDQAWLDDRNRSSFEASNKKLDEIIRQQTQSGGNP